MKKFLALAHSFALTLPLAACGGNPGNALLLRLVPLILKTAFRFPMHIWGLKAPW